MSPASSPSAPPAAADSEGDHDAGVFLAAEGTRGDEAVLLQDQRVPLRLTAAHGALGLELYGAVDIGPLQVLALSLTLPGLRFPIDLSGGVPKFRHRRGMLQHLNLQTELGALEGWLAPKLQGPLGALLRPPTVWCLPGGEGLGIGLVSSQAAVAFDLLWAPDAGDARLVVANARGAGLAAPPLALALRALDALAGAGLTRRGRVVRFADVGCRVGRLLLPAVGARAPSCADLRFESRLSSSEGRVRCTLDAAVPVPEYSDLAARALELAQLVHAADDALAAGDVDLARTEYLLGLEQAPRHPDIVRLVAEIDVRVRGRVEAALGFLVESLPVTNAGLLGAELLARTLDYEGARQAVAQSVRQEPFAPVAALQWLRLAELDAEAPSRALALDRAVAAAPGLALPRWARFEARLQRGDLQGALADAEHLELAASGSQARHAICARAGRQVLSMGYVRQAGKLFERALRYRPDDAAATAGLARALSEVGQTSRALVLLERAVELTEAAGRPDPDALIDLAKIVASSLKDLPQAVARVRQVSADSERLVEARFLEGLWRARLGDRAGAALAYGRMREAIELSAKAQPSWTAWLLEASQNAIGVDADPTAAERHLSVALRLSPHDPALAERYREAAAQVAERLRAGRDAALVSPSQRRS